MRKKRRLEGMNGKKIVKEYVNQGKIYFLEWWKMACESKLFFFFLIKKNQSI